MPRYRYTSPFPAVFMDLSNGVNATVIRADGTEVDPDGSTVVLAFDDQVSTEAPYASAWLDAVPDDETPPPPPTPPADPPVSDQPAPDPTPAAPAADQPQEPQA